MEKIIDATNQPLGRLASKIAILLQGKTSPSYEARLSGDLKVIIKNIRRLKVTGHKAEQKIYYHYSGYPGGLKKETFADLFARHPDRILRQAVYGMLPANRLRDRRLKNLIIE